MQHEQDQIVLVDEEGKEHTFTIIDVVMVDDNRYALLQPTDADEEEGAYLFRIDTEDGEDKLVVVEDDEEFERVAEVLAEFDDHEHGPGCQHDHHHEHGPHCNHNHEED